MRDAANRVSVDSVLDGPVNLQVIATPLLKLHPKVANDPVKLDDVTVMPFFTPDPPLTMVSTLPEVVPLKEVAGAFPPSATRVGFPVGCEVGCLLG